MESRNVSADMDFKNLLITENRTKWRVPSRRNPPVRVRLLLCQNNDGRARARPRDSTYPALVRHFTNFCRRCTSTRLAVSRFELTFTISSHCKLRAVRRGLDSLPHPTLFCTSAHTLNSPSDRIKKENVHGDRRVTGTEIQYAHVLPSSRWMCRHNTQSNLRYA
jgi:hypothetical protein